MSLKTAVESELSRSNFIEIEDWPGDDAVYAVISGELDDDPYVRVATVLFRYGLRISGEELTPRGRRLTITR
jgi:hypothetical protein